MRFTCGNHALRYPGAPGEVCTVVPASGSRSSIRDRAIALHRNGRPSPHELTPRFNSSFYRDPADWRALMDTLGLADKENTRFGRLSGGQKQRLSIALALVGSPQLAVLDELC